VGQRDPTAVVGRRVFGAFIDLVLWAGVYSMAFSRLARYVKTNGIADACAQLKAGGTDASTCFQLNDRAYFLGSSDSRTLSLLSLAWFIAIFVILQGVAGVTPGKAIAGVRVVREDGSPPGMGRALVRSLMWIIDAQPCGLPLVGFITALSSKGHRRVGDMAAKTFVVPRESVGHPVAVDLGPAPPAYGQPWTPGPTYPTSYPSAPPPAAAQPPVAAPPPIVQQPAAAPPASAAQWDAARGTYILWEPARQAWLQWDAASSSWVPIR
jgi:hypothetical protein